MTLALHSHGSGAEHPTNQNVQDQKSDPVPEKSHFTFPSLSIDPCKSRDHHTYTRLRGNTRSRCHRNRRILLRLRLAGNTGSTMRHSSTIAANSSARICLSVMGVCFFRSFSSYNATNTASVTFQPQQLPCPDLLGRLATAQMTGLLTTRNEAVMPEPQQFRHCPLLAGFFHGVETFHAVQTDKRSYRPVKKLGPIAHHTRLTRHN